MSIRVDDGGIWLEGRCLVDDAETLLIAIRTRPELPVDVGGAQRLHLAVVQVLLAAGSRLRGTVHSSFLDRHIFAALDFGWDKPIESS